MPRRGRGAIVIVGAGLTGGTAAKALRKQGYAGELLILTDEPGFPFGRPPLTKGYLRGEENLSGWMVSPLDWYKTQNVQVVPARVTSVEARARRLKLESGETIAFDRLLVATGGRNRPIDVPGAHLSGIYQLRTIAECDAIKRVAKPGSRVVVAGSGFIGSEVAASLRQLGLKVTSVMRGKAPLDAVLGPEVGGVFGAIHREAGIDLLAQDDVVRFEGSLQVERVVTRKGRRIACDLVVVAVGIEPNVEIVKGSGVATRDGILVDASCRTNVASIFAAGDVANHLHPIFGRVRVEHYNNAEKMAAAAARSMLVHTSPTATCTVSGAINSTTSLSTSAMLESGIALWSGGPLRGVSSWASICRPASCGRPSDSTEAVTRKRIQTVSWRRPVG